MAVNLFIKYGNKIAEKFTHESFIAGNVSNEYEFTGAKTIRIMTPMTVPVGTYNRNATGNRFGTPTEMQDTVQEMVLSQEPSFALTIDKGNNADQNNLKPAMKMLGAQIREQVTPFMDKHAFLKFAQEAGTVAGIDEPDVDNIVKDIFDGAAALDNGLVPGEDRYLYIPTKYYNMLRMSKEFLAVDTLAEKALAKGYVGMVADMKVIKVPDSYMPAGVYFIIAQKRCAMMPCKIRTARVLTEAPGIDGALLEGRNYFDAFVIGAKCEGVYAAVSAATAVALPVVAIASNKATVTAVSGVTFYYTLDGSDPRYSMTKQVYSAAVTTQAGDTIKVAGKNAAGYWSGVTEEVDD